MRQEGILPSSRGLLEVQILWAYSVSVARAGLARGEGKEDELRAMRFSGQNGI